jgi:hypothetical protein
MTQVDEFYESSEHLSKLILDTKDYSLYIWNDDYFSRFLVIIAANFFESKIGQLLGEFARKASNNQLVESFMRASMRKQYFTYFDWDEGTNANKFFSYFGTDFANQAKTDVKNNSSLKESIESFLMIGRTRNLLVHGDFFQMSLPKTKVEFYDSYKKAVEFLEYLKERLLLGE